MGETEERVRREKPVNQGRETVDSDSSLSSQRRGKLSLQGDPSRLSLSSSMVCLLFAGSFFFIGCGSAPAPQSVEASEEVEREGERPPAASIPDREGAINAIESAGGVPCGLADATQRAALPAERWRVGAEGVLVQLECAFFGLQGVYEYWLLSEGEARALSFSNSEPLQIPLPGRPAPERRSPASRERERDMLCGRPSYDAEHEQLESACLGQGGRCGAYSRYRLDREGLRFEVQERRMQPCAAMSDLSPTEWPTLR